jgi:PAS domain S-box-containing protein
MMVVQGKRRMAESDSLPLFHSWALFDAGTRFGTDQLDAMVRLHVEDVPEPPVATEPRGGVWSFDFANERLRWSREVYALFGLPQEERLTRALTVNCYAPRSRMAMESLREHAIKHRRGFTMDAMIRRPDGEARWMRLSAMPILSEGRVVRLCGTKRDITGDYDGPAWRRL